MFGCRHKYGLAIHGLQYCSKCGKAISAPALACSHKWKTIAEREKQRGTSGLTVSIVYILQCEKCGEIKSEKIE